MKKYVLILIILLGMICGCKTNSSSLKFKEDYELLNDRENKNGLKYRNVNIDLNNPYEEITSQDIINKIANHETFYVYFGDKLCPWCRSVIEKSIEVAKRNGIEKIYYIPIWDNDGEEVLRDKYVLENDEVVKVVSGSTDYYVLLELFDKLLKEYTLTNSNGEIVEVNEKRIYAPNFIYIEKGIPIKLITGVSNLQKSFNDELTNEILNDEDKIFENFFKN